MMGYSRDSFYRFDNMTCNEGRLTLVGECGVAGDHETTGNKWQGFRNSFLQCMSPFMADFVAEVI